MVLGVGEAGGVQACQEPLLDATEPEQVGKVAGMPEPAQAGEHPGQPVAGLLAEAARRASGLDQKPLGIATNRRADRSAITATAYPDGLKPSSSAHCR